MRLILYYLFIYYLKVDVDKYFTLFLFLILTDPSYYYTPSAARTTTGANPSLAATSPISPNNFKAERC